MEYTLIEKLISNLQRKKTKKINIFKSDKDTAKLYVQFFRPK